ncbi:sugar phosphate isomerase/epimerase [Kiritimatiellota bacterium B12222]|nr:sugar phosphate isomerase/epimerase [Kiritimatiellota bacterium B12222]
MTEPALNRLGGLIELGAVLDEETLSAELDTLQTLGFSEVYPGDALLVSKKKAEVLSSDVVIFPEGPQVLCARSREELTELRERVEVRGMEIHSAHYNQILPPPGEKADEHFFQLHEELLDRAALLGCRRVTTHPGWMFGVADAQYTGEAAKAFRAGAISLRELHAEARKLVGTPEAFMEMNRVVYREFCSRAAMRGITVTIETAIAEWPELTENPQAMMDFIASVGEGNLGICLDSGHCHFNAVDIASAIRVFDSALIETHFHDNHGLRDEHLPVGEGTIDWEGLISALREIDYLGGVTFEQRDHAQNVKIWREFIRL